MIRETLADGERVDLPRSNAPSSVWSSVASSSHIPAARLAFVYSTLSVIQTAFRSCEVVTYAGFLDEL